MEQFLFSSIVLLILFAILQGYIENYVYGHGFSTGGGIKLFGWLTPSYHLPLAVSWLSVCLMLEQWQFFPAFCVIQDWGWHRFNNKIRLDDTSWVNARWGGWYIWGNKTSKNNFWLPKTYVFGIGVTILLYSLTHIWRLYV